MGRGLSRSRSLTGRLTNKMKRGLKPLGLRSRSTMERAESQMRKQQQQKEKPSEGGENTTDEVKTSVARPDQSVDGGKTVHRNLVAQVRARSALLRQRAMSRSASINANQKINNNLNMAPMDEEDMASEPDDERVVRPDVFLRYKTAGRIADAAIKEVMRNVAPGESVFRLCNIGDEYIENKCSSTFTKAKDPNTGEAIKRGIAFPTNVSINNTLCHFRPMSEDQDRILQEGDVVKIHLGAQLDGYATTAAHTVVCSSGLPENTGGVQVDADGANINQHQGGVVSKQAANAVACAHSCMTALIRNMRLGASGAQLTDLIKSFASNYGVEACEGVLSNRTKRWILDGSSCIINRRVVADNPFQDVEDVEIDANQVWTLDIAFTTASTYKLIPEEATIYRRNELPTPHDMRIRAAERLLHEIRDHFLCFPFCPTQSEHGTNAARLGVGQLNKAGVIDVVPPMRSKPGSITARATCTIAITEKRIHILAGSPIMDAVAAQVADEIAPSLVEYTQKPLSFVSSGSGKDAAAAADADAAIDESIDATKTAVESAMKQVGESGLTSNLSKQQVSALLPPSAKKGNNSNNKDKKGSSQAAAGRRPMKDRKVEQD